MTHKVPIDAISSYYKLQGVPKTIFYINYYHLLSSACLIVLLTIASSTPFSWGGFFFTDSFLNLTGTYGVVDRSIAIHQANRGELLGIAVDRRNQMLCLCCCYCL